MRPENPIRMCNPQAAPMDILKEKGVETMIHADTIRLLRECDAGVRMGVSSIGDVLAHAPSDELASRLDASKREHEALGAEIRAALERFGDEGKAPNPMARGMAWLKTSAELTFSPSDPTAAGLIAGGCDMGVASLRGYLGKYAAADESSKEIAKRLIALEETLSTQMRDFC